MARILLIDDERNIRLMVGMALQQLGHTVETATDGPEGLEKFGRGEGFDLVLLDQRMPGMDGLAVLRELLWHDPSARVIMLTAFGTIELAVEAMKAGAADFLRKPFMAETLGGAVKAALERPARGSEPGGQPASAASAPISFGLTTINGFQIAGQHGRGRAAGDGRRFAFLVRSPLGEARVCGVVLPGHLMRQARAHIDRDEIPGGDLFWRSLAEESLANYVWQNADFPPDDDLIVDELTAGIRRWIDAVRDGAME